MATDWDALTKIVGHISSMVTMLGMGWLAYKQAELRANVKDVKTQTQTVLTHTTAQTDKIDKIEATVAEVAAGAESLRAAQARALAEIWLPAGSGTIPER